MKKYNKLVTNMSRPSAPLNPTSCTQHKNHLYILRGPTSKRNVKTCNGKPGNSPRPLICTEHHTIFMEISMSLFRYSIDLYRRAMTQNIRISCKLFARLVLVSVFYIQVLKHIFYCYHHISICHER